MVDTGLNAGMCGGYLREFAEKRAVDVAEFHKCDSGCETKQFLDYEDKDICERKHNRVDSKQPDSAYRELREITLRDEADCEICGSVCREGVSCGAQQLASAAELPDAECGHKPHGQLHENELELVGGHKRGYEHGGYKSEYGRARVEENQDYDRDRANGTR